MKPGAAVLIGLAILTSACGSSHSTAHSSTTTTLPANGTAVAIRSLGPLGRPGATTIVDNGGTAIVAGPGQQFEVSLAANGSTGFQWEAVVNEPSAITEVAYDYIVLPESHGLVGGGGTAVFRFEAHTSGRATITFNYRRPWETTAAPLFSRHISIVVG